MNVQEKPQMTFAKHFSKVSQGNFSQMVIMTDQALMYLIQLKRANPQCRSKNTIRDWDGNMSKTDSELTLHFLLKFSEKKKGIDTMAEHLQALKKHGAVWWGKFGRPPNITRIETARDQIRKGTPTHVYLVNRGRLVARASVEETAATEDKVGLVPADSSLVPAYYRDRPCPLWFKFSVIDEMNELPDLFLWSNPEKPASLKGQTTLVYLAAKTDTT